MRLMLRRKALRSVLDGLLLGLLLGICPGGIGLGGRRVTLGVRVATLIHYSVFAIPIFEQDQHVHVQMRKKLGGRTRVRRRKLLGKVE